MSKYNNFEGFMQSVVNDAEKNVIISMENH